MEHPGYHLNFRRLEQYFYELWAMKSHVRKNVNDWLTASNVSSRTSELCADACSELLENCIKYTSNGSMAEVSVYLSDRTVVIETINSAQNKHIELLCKFLDALHENAEPKQLFVEQLLNPVEKKSHLGLIRIMLETNGTLERVEEKKKGLVHLKLHVKKD